MHRLTPQEVFLAGETLAIICGYPKHQLDRRNMLRYFVQMAEIAKDAIGGSINAKKKRAKFETKCGLKLEDWALELRKLYDRFHKEAEIDPMIQYFPMHKVAEEFHASPALIRWFCAGNRTSKTLSGYAEHYLVHTGQHRWRSYPSPLEGKLSSFIVGLAFSKYGPSVFEQKLLTGESGNYLSPMFPIGGRWFYHYDDRKKIIQLACPHCAWAGKAGSCPHPKSTITLFSDEGGWEVLQGRQDILGHFDEHIPEEFYTEALQRLLVLAPRGAGLMVTGTPLFGTDAWEVRRLQSLVDAGPPTNLRVPTDPDSPPIVTMHRVSQYEAGISTKEDIDQMARGMDEFEVLVRVHGLPMPLTKNPVFDRVILAEMRKNCKDPLRVAVGLVAGRTLEAVTDGEEFDFNEYPEAPVRVWEKPVPGATYILGVDTAKGLTKGDASCTQVLKLERDGLAVKLRIVAQWHSFDLNPLDYAVEVFKLAVWYNSGLVVIETTGGYGDAVFLKLRQELFYWNLYSGTGAPEMRQFQLASRLGMETNIRTKPAMIATVQKLLRDRGLVIEDEPTINEMVAFEQERTESGLHTRFQGASRSHDDRVMALALACSVAISSPLFMYQEELQKSDDSVELPLEKVYSGPWLDIHRELKATEDVESWMWD